MKKLLFALSLLLSVAGADAQTFSLSSNSRCRIYWDLYYTDANGDSYVFGNKIYQGMTDCNTSTYVAGCQDLQGVPPLTFNYLYVYSFQGSCQAGNPVSDCPNPDWVYIGSAKSGYNMSDCFESTSSCNLCTPGEIVTATWNDLGNGDVQVDFN